MGLQIDAAIASRLSPCVSRDTDMKMNHHQIPIALKIVAVLFIFDGIMDVLSGNRNYNTGEPAGAVWVFDAFDALQASEDTLTAGTGGKVDFDLNATADYANRLYLILGSVSGTEPGLPLSPGVTIPINWDPLTELLINLLSSPALVDFTGNLDGSGKAAAALDSLGPIPPDAVGLVMSFAYACMDYPFDFASNPVNVEIVP